MSDPLRLFLALWPGAGSRAGVVAAQQQIPWPAVARIYRPQDLHITLHFLGAVPVEELPRIDAAADVPSGQISLTLDRLDVWHGGVAVLRPTAVPAALNDLHGRLQARLLAAGLRLEDRPYQPHVTLARGAKGLQPGPVAPVPWRSRGHALVLSGGGQYRVLRRFLGACK